MIPSGAQDDVIFQTHHPERRTDLGRPPSHTPAPGFLGSTSFSAVYQEERGLNALQYSSEGDSLSNAGTIRRLYPPNRESQIKKGMSCLALLVDLPTMEPMISQWEQMYFCVTIMSPFTSTIQKAVKSSIHSAIANAHGSELEDILAEKSAEIYRNSMLEFRVPPNCSLDQYATLMAEPLRWDAIGIYFTACGLSACYANQGVSRSIIEQRRQLAKVMLEASDTCISLCEELGQMTDQETWLYCENAHLVSVVEGDASYMFWRRLGDFFAACITKGLHTGSIVSPEVPFWLSEIRKRTFGHAYNLDKSISSFMGRPPRLPRKYCSMQLPLDLDLTMLQLSDAQLEIEVEKLDEDGWNTAGDFRSNLYTRSSLVCNMIREDILELALASLPHDNIAVAKNILHRSRAAWESFPAWIRQMREQPHRDGLLRYLSNEIALNFKYNEFLLYRAVVKRFPTSNEANEEELLRLSAETLASIMDNVSHKNVLGKYDCDLPWTLAQFALPTAGVLALELLRQSQGLSPSRPISAFNRSGVIQNLSNLVSALAWAVLPFDGNYEICNQARQVLQHILDRVLSSPATTRSATNDLSDGAKNEVSGTGTSGGDYTWFNQVSSEPEFWSSLPSHPLLLA